MGRRPGLTFTVMPWATLGCCPWEVISQDKSQGVHHWLLCISAPSSCKEHNDIYQSTIRYKLWGQSICHPWVLGNPYLISSQGCSCTLTSVYTDTCFSLQKSLLLGCWHLQSILLNQVGTHTPRRIEPKSLHLVYIVEQIHNQPPHLPKLASHTGWPPFSSLSLLT